MNPRLRSLLVPALFTALAGALLVGLGIWQLQRLAWKDAIIARIAARTKAAAQPLPAPSSWNRLAPADYEYRRVTLDGRYDNDHETLVFRGAEDGPGYLVMTPLALRGGGVVLVNRGFVPAALKDKARRISGDLSGDVRVVGLMRGPEPRNLFTPADDPAANQFFTRDPAAIAAHLGLVGAAPFSIDADATPNPGGWPRGGATELAIPNNHLSYALTWFGLALGLLGVFLSFAWRRLQERDGGDPRDIPGASGPAAAPPKRVSRSPSDVSW